MSNEPKLCEDCLAFMGKLLDERIRRILEVGREEVSDGDDGDIGQSHCFHLMEIRRIIEGKKTCGLYDDYGPPLTINGPLFRRARVEEGRDGN